MDNTGCDPTFESFVRNCDPNLNPDPTSFYILLRVRSHSMAKRNSRALPCPPHSIASGRAGTWEWSERRRYIALADLLDIASEVDPRKRGAGCFALKMLRSASLCASLAILKGNER